ncbi:hypothetical protein D3C85_1347560 [compost metagenome]
MSHRILNDQRLQTFGMGEHHSEPDRAAVVLHIQRVLVQAEGFGEMLHHTGQVIERVGKRLRIRRIAMTKPRIVRRHQMIVLRQPCQQRVIHTRRTGKTVQQQQRWRIRRTGFTIENRQVIDLDTAVGNRHLFLRIACRFGSMHGVGQRQAQSATEGQGRQQFVHKTAPIEE